MPCCSAISMIDCRGGVRGVPSCNYYSHQTYIQDVYWRESWDLHYAVFAVYSMEYQFSFSWGSMVCQWKGAPNWGRALIAIPSTHSESLIFEYIAFWASKTNHIVLSTAEIAITYVAIRLSSGNRCPFIWTIHTGWFVTSGKVTSSAVEYTLQNSTMSKYWRPVINPISSYAIRNASCSER